MPTKLKESTKKTECQSVVRKYDQDAYQQLFDRYPQDLRLL